MPGLAPRLALWIIAVGLIIEGCHRDSKAFDEIDQIYAAVQYCTGFILIGIALAAEIITPPTKIWLRAFQSFGDAVVRALDSFGCAVGKLAGQIVKWLRAARYLAGKSNRLSKRKPDLISDSMVICKCNLCSQNIEFERANFDSVNPPAVTCPHCGTATTLYIPPSFS